MRIADMFAVPLAAALMAACTSAQDGQGARTSSAVSPTISMSTSTSHSSARTAPSQALGVVLQKLWSTRVERDGLSSAAVGAGHIVVVDRTGRVFGMDDGTGKIRWEIQTPSFIGPPPVIVGDTVLIYVAGQGVAALDVGDGSVRWQRHAVFTDLSSPIAVCAGVVAVNDGTHVVGVDLSTGRSLWSRAIVSARGVRPLNVIPASDDQRFYAVVRETGSGTVARALSPRDGSVLWQRSIPAFASDGGASAQHGESVGGLLVAVDENRLGARTTALDPATGEVRWSITQPGVTAAFGPIVAYGNYALLAHDFESPSRPVAINRTNGTGHVATDVQLDKVTRCGMLICATERNMQSVDLLDGTGHVVASAHTSGDQFVDAVFGSVADPHVYALSMGHVIAYRRP